MKKLLMMAAMMVTLTASMAVSAMALEYQVDAPKDAIFAPATSVEQVTVVGGGVTEADNIDRSKNAALIPPPFGSPESNQTGSGTVLTPGIMAGGAASGGTPVAPGGAYYPPADTGGSSVTVTPSTKFTLPDGLYYSDGSLGILKIPSWGYQSRSMKRRAWRVCPRAPATSNSPPAGTEMWGWRATTVVSLTTSGKSTR